MSNVTYFFLLTKQCQVFRNFLAQTLTQTSKIKVFMKVVNNWKINATKSMFDRILKTPLNKKTKSFKRFETDSLRSLPSEAIVQGCSIKKKSSKILQNWLQNTFTGKCFLTADLRPMIYVCNSIKIKALAHLFFYDFRETFDEFRLYL